MGLERALSVIKNKALDIGLAASIAAASVAGSCCEYPEHSIPVFRQADSIRTDDELEESMHIAEEYSDELLSYETVEPLLRFMNDYSVYLVNRFDSRLFQEFYETFPFVSLTIGDKNDYSYPVPHYCSCSRNIYMLGYRAIGAFVMVFAHEMAHAQEDIFGKDTGESYPEAFQEYSNWRMFEFDPVIGMHLIVESGIPYDKGRTITSLSLADIINLNLLYHLGHDETWEKALENISGEEVYDIADNVKPLFESHNNDFRAVYLYLMEGFVDSLSRNLDNTQDEIPLIQQFVSENMLFSYKDKNNYCASVHETHSQIESSADDFPQWFLDLLDLRQEYDQARGRCQE